MGARVGFGRGDLSVFEPGLAMLGWGRSDQLPEGIGAPLLARAMVAVVAGRPLALVCCDLCFVSAALRVRVLAALRREGIPIAPSDLLLTATHTHSGPNGFSHALFYDLSGPGLSRRVLAHLSRGIVDSIREALARAAPARLRLGVASIPRRAPIAINRALSAFRRNAEVSGAASAYDAIDRTVTVLRADDRAGRPLGMVSLFALHATSLHGDGRRLHPDHKGLAAARFEAEQADPGFVALFAQGAAGDVSPNVRFDRGRGVMVGVHDDDLASAEYVAAVQVRAARAAFLDAREELAPPWRAALCRVELEERPVSSRFAPPGARTTPGRLGLAMAAGTAEGPGPLAGWPMALARRLPVRGDDPKRTLLEIGPGVARRLGGVLDPTRLPLPHPAFARVARVHAAGGLGDAPWIPTVLPLQLWQLGSLVIAALPNEPTTMVGARLARLLREALGVEHARVLGYSNAYSGYLTTPEEYALQGYEGAYTLFGPHTFAAFATELERLARRLPTLDGRDEGPPLPVCSPDEEAARCVRAAPSP